MDCFDIRVSARPIVIQKIARDVRIFVADEGIRSGDGIVIHGVNRQCNNGCVRAAIPIFQRIFEAVCTVEIGIRCVSEGAVRVQNQRAVGDICDQGG